jgi:predicted TIM-barrel fold metal-dependent hydrolase
MSSAGLWTHSGDSHLSEPDHLWMHVLRVADAARMPWSKWGDGDEQIINVDGEIFRRHVPQAARRDGRPTPRGITDVDARLDDMTSECVWAEVVYCATAMWLHRIRDTALLGRACRALNRWLADDVRARAPERLVPAALLPPHDPETATSELEHVAELGLHLVELPCEQRGEVDWNHPAWERLWERAARHHVVVGFHATTDHPAVTAAGRGGTLANYAMTGHVGQRTVAKLVAAGVLDRHPDLRVLVAESGVGWVPYLAERMEEGYWSQRPLIDTTLVRGPKECVYSQVYATFQHEPSAGAVHTALGYPNAMFARDYPHHEGTWGHTQRTIQTLHEATDSAASERLRLGTFQELFPHVSSPVPT